MNCVEIFQSRKGFRGESEPHRWWKEHRGGHRVDKGQEKHGIRLISAKCEVNDGVLGLQIARKRTPAVHGSRELP